VPRAPLPAVGVTHGGKTSCILSEGITPPSSLLRTHVSNHLPPADFGNLLFRPVFAGCCQPLLGVGPSRRYLRSLSEDAWTPTPSRSWRLRPFVRPSSSVRTLRIAGHRPRPSGTGSARRSSSLPCNFDRGRFSGLQSFANVQAPSLARPPGCSHRCDQRRAAGPFTSRNAHGVTLGC
jgi:hypothetical protein